MKKILIIGGVILVIIASVVSFIIIANKNDDPKSNNTNTQQSQTLTQKITSQNGQLIDVRTPEEFNASHAKDSINVPLADLQNGDFSKIDKNKPVYLYCRSGNRAGQAKIILEQNGYKNVTNIGGLEDFKNQGGTVIVY